MSIELRLIKAFSNPLVYNKLSKYVKKDGLTEEAKWVLDKLKCYFEEGYESVESAEEFITFVLNHLNLKLKPEFVEKVQTIVTNALELPEEDGLGVIKKFYEEYYALKINDVTNRMLDGDTTADLEAIYKEVEAYKKDIQFKDEDKLQLVNMDVAHLIKINAPQDGLKWRLQALNEVAGGVRLGDLIIIFARPDSGKTSFVVDQTIGFLKQVEEGKQIIWFNNEELGDRIAMRYYTNIHNTPNVPLDAPPLSDKVVIYDAPAITKRDVEEYLTRHNPACIVFNSMDKIKGFEKSESDTRRLRDLYQWARELAKKYAPVIAVCQCNAEGEGVKALTMDMLADSKTDKAGEADLIIGIGRASGDDDRYISTPKNKLTGTRKDIRQLVARPVKFDMNTGRYYDYNSTALPD